MAENNNKYRVSRDHVHKTLEGVSEETGISVSRLQKIEHDYPVTPDEIVVLAKCYKDMELYHGYCANECPVGKEIGLKVMNPKELAPIVLNTMAALNAVQEKQKRLIEISADGKIDDSELEDFIAIKSDLEKIAMTAEALKAWCNQQITEEKINMDKYMEYTTRCCE